MKLTTVILALFAATSLSQAAWVIQQQGVGGGATNLVVLTITGDKAREEIWGDKIGHVVSINDMNTADQIALYPDTKTFKRTSGAKIRELVARLKAQGGIANAPNGVVPVPWYAGVIEKVGDYECDIYKWADRGRGITNTLWVAKSFARYEKIRPYLARLDEFQSKGLDSGVQPALGGLPGMVVKSELVVRGQKEVTMLLSVREVPDRGSLFEVPLGYKEGKKP